MKSQYIQATFTLSERATCFPQWSSAPNTPPPPHSSLPPPTSPLPSPLKRDGEGASPSPHKIIYTPRIEMTDGFLGHSDIFKVAHKRQGTSEMEGNHYSPGLRSSYHASAAKAVEGDGNICEVREGAGGAYVFMHVSFYACQVRLQTQIFTMPFPPLT